MAFALRTNEMRPHAVPQSDSYCVYSATTNGRSFERKVFLRCRKILGFGVCIENMLSFVSGMEVELILEC